jgi:DNA-directed RNA polymerase subunit RPC12/RpoP
MNKLYMCAGCGYQLVDDDTKKLRQCPECIRGRKLMPVSGQCISTIRKETVIPGFGQANFVMSVEAAQDMRVIELELEKYKSSEPSEEEIAFWKHLEDRHFFGKIRTPDPTEEEMAEWRKWDQFFSKLDLDAVKRHYKVHVLYDQEPYSDLGVDHTDCEHAKMFNKGEPFDWMKKAWNFETFWDLWTEWDKNGREEGHRLRSGAWEGHCL